MVLVRHWINTLCDSNILWSYWDYKTDIKFECYGIKFLKGY